MNEPVYHTIIIGAGASGLFCAGSFPARKLVLEHNAAPAAKLRVSGGGKCNFTNLHVSPADYQSASKHFCKNALAAFTAQDFLALVKRAGIAYEEKPDGRVFGRDARDLTAWLIRRAQEQNSDIRCNVRALRLQQENGLLRVETSAGVLRARHLVVAAGGPSFPALGATNFAAQAAGFFGVPLTPQRPALCALRLPKAWRGVCRQLAGNSLEAALTLDKRTERGALLFTHEGVSGPAVMQTSLYWQEGQEVRINFLPVHNAEEILRVHKNEPFLFSKILTPFIPAKISAALLGPLNVRACDAPKQTLLQAARQLNDFRFVPPATAGYARAEVTAGGADVKFFNPSTLECKNAQGVFFTGEGLDVTGRLGGYNLHWAWASAACAAAELRRRA